jgi:hypothetical protein
MIRYYYPVKHSQIESLGVSNAVVGRQQQLSKQRGARDDRRILAKTLRWGFATPAAPKLRIVDWRKLRVTPQLSIPWQYIDNGSGIEFCNFASDSDLAEARISPTVL